MTTAAPSKPAPKPAVVPKVISELPVRLDLIDVVSNVRKKFEGEALKELTENIRSLGVISPITLRPGKKAGRFELVAGERRFRAATAAGLVSIPARTLELNDQQALEYQAAENIHRKDLTPIEQAQAFKALTQPGKDGQARYTVEQLAPIADKTVGYIYRSMRLLELSEKALAALEANEISEAHAHQLLRVPASDQATYLAMAKNLTAKQLKERLDWDAGTDLAKATFPKDKPYANCVACSVCPFNSANQGMLFTDPQGAEKGRCMDNKCFEKKTTAARQDKIEALRKKHPQAKFVQAISGYIYNGHGSNGYTVSGTFDPKTAPKDFAIFISTMDGTVYLGRPDKTAKAKSGGSPSGAGSTPVKQDPKAEFIAEQQKKALGRAVAENSKKMTRKHLLWLAAQSMEMISGDPADVDAALGFEVDVHEKTKLTDAQLCQVIFVASMQDCSGDINEIDAKAIGIDVTAANKAAKAAAEKAWAEKQAKATPDPKATKAKG